MLTKCSSCSKHACINSFHIHKSLLDFHLDQPVSLGQVDLNGQAMVLTNLNPVRNWIRREYPRPEINPVSFHSYRCNTAWCSYSSPSTPYRNGFKDVVLHCRRTTRISILVISFTRSTSNFSFPRCPTHASRKPGFLPQNFSKIFTARYSSKKITAWSWS